MKNFRLSIAHPDSDVSLTPETLFALTDYFSKDQVKTCAAINGLDIAPEEKLERIQQIKERTSNILAQGEIRSLLRSYFYVDGAIRMSEEDLNALEKMFFRLDENGKNLGSDDAFFETYMLNFVNDFVYFHGKELVFRNEKYYFQFPSLTVDRKQRFSSVNDFDVLDINRDDFQNDFLEQYNAIDQNIQLFSTHFEQRAIQGIAKNAWDFSREISNMLTPKKLKEFKKKLQVTGNTGNQGIDDHFHEQWEKMLRWLGFFRDLVNLFAANASYYYFREILRFISDQSLLLQYAKVTFGVDIDSVLNKYFKIEPNQPIQKMLLGFLDAKINMVAFMQNVTQLLYSEQFLNPDYDWSLVFDCDTVRNIKKTCPKEFVRFKELQKELNTDEDWKYALLSVLDSHVGYFMDVLLGNNDIAYVKIIWELPIDLPEITTGKTNMARTELTDGLRLLSSYLELMESYVAVGVKKAQRKQSTQTPRSTLIHQKALKKIIRPYREENDPVVMIATAQNALNSIIQKGYKPNKDVLHIMGVNYGGSLTGLYAKYVFSKSVNRGQVISNVGNIVYSIYDVKNANTFLKLADYPIAQIMQHEDIDPVTKSKLRDQNWLLIFDDNINSGETLDNLRLRAEESGFYGRIDTFACRASNNMSNYRSSITDVQKLDFVTHSAVPARKTRVNPEGKRYKELLGTIVGNRIHKIMNPKNDESKAE